jgi:hypothetical protein
LAVNFRGWAAFHASSYLETRLTHLHWAEGLILLVAAIGVSLSLGGRFIASFERDRMDGV